MTCLPTSMRFRAAGRAGPRNQSGADRTGRARRELRSVHHRRFILGIAGGLILVAVPPSTLQVESNIEQLVGSGGPSLAPPSAAKKAFTLAAVRVLQLGNAA
jgi:hypothetical protein